MVRTSRFTTMARSASSPQRFRKRVSVSVPKFSDTYRSVQPASGVSGPSSRSIFNASFSERGRRSVRSVTADLIERRLPGNPRETTKHENTKAKTPLSPFLSFVVSGLVFSGFVVSCSSRLLNRAIDRRVAGAPAEIAGKTGANRVKRRPAAERDRGHDHPRRTDAALRAAVLDEGALQRMARVETFNRRHARAVHMSGRHKTRVDRRAVHQHGARPTLTFAAPLFRSGQPAILAEDIEQPFQRVHIDPDSLPVQVNSQGSTLNAE